MILLLYRYIQYDDNDAFFFDLDHSAAVVESCVCVFFFCLPGVQEILDKVAAFALLPRCVSKRIQRIRVKVREVGEHVFSGIK